MVGREARLLQIFYFRRVGGFGFWKKEVRAHHLGRVGGNENSEVGQNIFKEEGFGKRLNKVPDGLVGGWNTAE